jgi:hypothetical protein
MSLHIIKLAVGIDTVPGLAARQAGLPTPLRHRTRNFPRRAAEILDGGSLYWVINRIVSVRQRILDIEPGEREDGTRCTDLLLDPSLVPVQPQFRKPFQGWRYLPAAEAPADAARGFSDQHLPERLQRELAALCLL